MTPWNRLMTSAPRIWWLSATLSMLVPGLGQVYNGQLGRGILLCAAMLTAGLGSLLYILVQGLLFLWLALPIMMLLLIHIWIITDAMIVARRLNEYVLKPVNRVAVYIAFSAAVLVVFQAGQVLVARHCFSSYRVTATSLDGTLVPGDSVLSNRLAFGLVSPGRSQPTMWWRTPEPNEAVLYRSANNPDQVLAGRFVAAAGQRVELGQTALTVDGAVISFLSDGLTSTGRQRQSFKVPDESLCILHGSAVDSVLTYRAEVIPKGNLVGQPMLVYWSWDEGASRARLERVGIPVL